MAVTKAPYVFQQEFTDNGVPAAGYLVFVFVAGTTTPTLTYSDGSASPAANANPIVLDSAGRCSIFLPAGSFKFCLALPTDTTCAAPLYTQDNILSVPETFGGLDVQGAAGTPGGIAAGSVVYLSDGSGGLTAGSWYMADADFVYASSGAGVIGMTPNFIDDGETGSIRLDGRITGLTGLVAGTTYYVSATAGGLTSTAPGHPRIVGVADTTTSIVLGPGKPDYARRVSAQIINNGNVTTGEDILHSYTAPAGELSADRMSYHGRFWGTTANNANTKTIRLRVIEGANNTVVLAFVCTASELGEWVVEWDILRASSTTFRGSAEIKVGPANGPVSRTGTNEEAATATWSNSVQLLLSADATATNDIVVTGGTITLVP